MRYLIDTNVLSELLRQPADATVLRWSSGVTWYALSVVTVEEVFFGLTWKPHVRLREAFDVFLHGPCEVVSVTPEVAQAAGEMRGRLQARGLRRSQSDMLIAATALTHTLTLATRNTADFEHCGIAVYNPFK